MSSHNDSAIIFENVCKTYRLYQNKWQMVKDALGFKVKENIQEFYALKDVNLNIKQGERIGLIGRNGAGKSTLLKLITGNFAPSSGKIAVNGSVQALMNTGVGFHPEFTGLQNIKSSLLYNGLNQQQLANAIEDIIDFVELGDFLEQPLKTYSLGMQSRLYFAVATAIIPEILIVDEVLGAGDAYFSAKSAERMKKLTQTGCTIILVSHSSQQVLQFCEKGIWLECGEIIMEDKAIEVIKSYEEYNKKLEIESLQKQAASSKSPSVIQSQWLREKLLSQVVDKHQNKPNDLNSKVSRWDSHETGLRIHAINMLNANGEIISTANTDDKLDIEMVIQADAAGEYDAYFMILLFTEDGRWLSRNCSDHFKLSMASNEKMSVTLRFDQLLLGNGKYIFSAGIYKVLDLNDLSTARYYDVLSRSFEFTVHGRYKIDETIFYHPATWVINPKQEIQKNDALSLEI